MSFRKWVEDTEALFRLMPANSPIKHRLEELIINARDFALIGHTLDMVKIDLPEIEVPGKTFFVLERPLEFSHIGGTRNPAKKRALSYLYFFATVRS